MEWVFISPVRTVSGAFVMCSMQCMMSFSNVCGCGGISEWYV